MKGCNIIRGKENNDHFHGTEHEVYNWVTKKYRVVRTPVMSSLRVYSCLRGMSYVWVPITVCIVLRGSLRPQRYLEYSDSGGMRSIISGLVFFVALIISFLYLLFHPLAILSVLVVSKILGSELNRSSFSEGREFLSRLSDVIHIFLIRFVIVKFFMIACAPLFLTFGSNGLRFGVGSRIRFFVL